MSTVDNAILAAHLAEDAALIGIAQDAGCDPEWMVGVFLEAAHPLIEAAVRGKVAAEIEEARYNFRRLTATTDAADLISRVYDDTARIARNGAAS